MINKDDLRKLYLDDKLTQAEIGKMYGCDRKNIDYYLKKYNIPKRSKSEAHMILNNNRRGFEITSEIIMSYVNEGMLVGEVAKLLGVSRGTLTERLSSDGINLANHEHQRKKQSEFMSNNNPVPKGTKRPAYIHKAMAEGRKIVYEIKKQNITSFKLYARVARSMAYSYFSKTIPVGMEIDHMYSIRDGYINNVPLDIISHPYNLRLVTAYENRSKQCKSIITLKELYNGCGVQRLGGATVGSSDSKCRASEKSEDIV